jgi:hypothetical protein
VQPKFAQRLKQADIRIILTMGNVLVFLQTHPNHQLESAVIDMVSLLLPRLAVSDANFDRLLQSMTSRSSHDAVRHALCSVVTACGPLTLSEVHITSLSKITRHVLGSKNKLVQHTALQALAQFSQTTPQVQMLDRLVPSDAQNLFRAFLAAEPADPIASSDSVQPQQLKAAISAILNARKRTATPDAEAQAALVKRRRPSAPGSFEGALEAIDDLLESQLPAWAAQEIAQMRERMTAIQQDCSGQ